MDDQSEAPLRPNESSFCQAEAERVQKGCDPLWNFFLDVLQVVSGSLANGASAMTAGGCGTDEGTEPGPLQGEGDLCALWCARGMCLAGCFQEGLLAQGRELASSRCCQA